jgi:hypothetical protein
MRLDAGTSSLAGIARNPWCAGSRCGVCCPTAAVMRPIDLDQAGPALTNDDEVRRPSVANAHTAQR